MSLTVTDRAARRIREIAASEPARSMLRISVEGGGCSGFQYKLDLVDRIESDDYVAEKGGAKVLVDQISLPYLLGSEVDFVDDLMGAEFKIKNPNATQSCGCGTSFSV